MVQGQGGRVEALEKLATVHRVPVIREMKADRSGVLRKLDAGVLGRAVLELGAGRTKASDPIDPAVGVDQMRKTGQTIRAGDTVLRIHARSQAAAELAEQRIATGIEISD
jgi:thymidine phosphorylase